MKLQGLSIVFGLIIIPIILILSYYITLQVDTITLQTSYDTKLIDATSDAMAAFELNTANEDLSSVADSLRTIIEASSNVFINTLATNLGLSNASKSYIEPYIPAMLYTLYDGYYIYSPTEVPVILSDKNGVAVTIEEKRETDNSLRISTPGLSSLGNNRYRYEENSPIYHHLVESVGSVNDEDYGQLLYKVKDDDSTYPGEEYTTNINLKDKSGKKSAIETKVDYVLKSYMPYSARYVRDSTDENKKIDITINYTLDNYLTIEGNIGKIYYTKSGYLIKSDFDHKDAKDKNIVTEVEPDSILKYNENDAEKLIEKMIQEGKEVRIKVNDIQIVANDGEDEKQAVIYYIKAKIFSDWVYSNLGELEESDIVENNSSELYKSDNGRDEVIYSFNEKRKIFNKGEIGTLDDTYFGTEKDTYFGTEKDTVSVFSNHKFKVIRNSIQYNLNLAMSSYNSQTASSYNFSMPIISNSEWNKITSNVSLVTFMQGLNCGLKKYSNYAIVTSSNNELTVIPEDIYYIPYTEDSPGHWVQPILDKNTTSIYHRIDCPNLNSADKYTSFVSKEVKYDKIYDKTSSKYKYDHQAYACYTCIVDGNYDSKKLDDLERERKEKAYYIAVGKERNNIYKMNAQNISEGYEIIYDKDKISKTSSKKLSEIKSIEITFGGSIGDSSTTSDECRFRVGTYGRVDDIDKKGTVYVEHAVVTKKVQNQTVTINVSQENSVGMDQNISCNSLEFRDITSGIADLKDKIRCIKIIYK